MRGSWRKREVRFCQMCADQSEQVPSSGLVQLWKYRAGSYFIVSVNVAAMSAYFNIWVHRGSGICRCVETLVSG